MVEHSLYTDLDTVRCKKLRNGNTRCVMEAERDGEDYTKGLLVEELGLNGMGNMNISLEDNGEGLAVTEGWSLVSKGHDSNRVLNCNVTEEGPPQRDEYEYPHLSCEFSGGRVETDDKVKEDFVRE